MFVVAFLDNSYLYSIVVKDEIYINSKLEQFFGMPELIERLHQIYIKSMKITKNFKIQICVSCFKSHSVISTICNGFLIKNTHTSPAWLWLIFMLAYIYLTHDRTHEQNSSIRKMLHNYPTH